MRPERETQHRQERRGARPGPRPLFYRLNPGNPTPMQWRPFPAVITAIFAVLAGSFFQIKHNRALEAARHKTQRAIVYAAQASEITLAALQYADSVSQAAEAAETRAARQIAAARAPLPVLPDTCAPALIALAQADSAYQSEHQAAQELRSGLEAVVPASGALVVATGRLGVAAGELVKASRPSFLARLKPDIGIGATVGIDPETSRFSKAVGVTISWRIL